jgi:hypothetical protein
MPSLLRSLRQKYLLLHYESVYLCIGNMKARIQDIGFILVKIHGTVCPV